jgi:hypothetical protein
MSLIVKSNKRPKKAAKESCDICCQDITAVLRRPMECAYCGFKACVACCKNYLLKTADAHCMNCKKAWSFEFLKQNFTKTFVNEHLEHHHVKVFIELEKSLFPETLEYMHEQDQLNNMAHVERKSNYLTDTIADIETYLARLQAGEMSLDNRGGRRRAYSSDSETERETLINQADNDLVMQQLHDILRNVKNEYGVRRSLSRIIDDAGSNILLAQVVGVYQEYLRLLYLELEECFKEIGGKTKKVVAVRCMTNKCAGYVTAQSKSEGVDDPILFCKICRAWQCGECMVQFTANPSATHECDPEMVKTIKMIKKHCKPCPNCKEPIEKNTGCDQMFCTLCHTAFDWVTNTIIQGRVHNPHYFEWLKNAPAALTSNDDAAECNENLTWSRNFFLRMNGLARTLNIYDTNDYKSLLSLYELMPHIIALHIEPRANAIANISTRNRDLRIRVLEGHITVEEWENKVFIDRKHQATNTTRFFIYEALVFMVRSIFEQVIVALNTLSTSITDTLPDTVLDSFLDQCIVAVKYFNTHNRQLEADLKHKLYQKIMIPHLNHRTFSFSNEYITENELEFRLSNISQMIDVVMTPAENELFLVLETTFLDLELKSLIDLDYAFSLLAPLCKLLVLTNAHIQTLITEPMRVAKQTKQRMCVFELLQDLYIKQTKSLVVQYFKQLCPVVRDTYWLENKQTIMNRVLIDNTRNDLRQCYAIVYQEDHTEEVVGARPTSYFEQEYNSLRFKKVTQTHPEAEHVAHAIFSLGEWYMMPRSLGWHITNTSFLPLTIQVPMWAASLLEPSFLIHPSHVAMFQPPLFSAYVNDQLVNLEEVALLPYLYKDEYSQDDIAVHLTKFMTNHDDLFSYYYTCPEIDKQRIRHHPNYTFVTPAIKQKFASSFTKWRESNQGYALQRRMEMLFKG